MSAATQTVPHRCFARQARPYLDGRIDRSRWLSSVRADLSVDLIRRDGTRGVLVSGSLAVMGEGRSISQVTGDH